jgi:membrane protein YqaA with SNARE-associated domain
MPSVSRWILGLFLSPLGVVVLAALDSTLFFSLPLGIDAVVVMLAARMKALAWIVPLLATFGGVVGAALTFWMGIKIGDAGLERYVDARRLERIRCRIRERGAIALAILDLMPPPFPFTPFVLAAGALEVDVRLFFTTLAVCRLLRFGVEALLGVLYGRSILRLLDSDLFHDIVAGCIVLALVLTALSIYKVVRSTRTSGRQSALRARA